MKSTGENATVTPPSLAKWLTKPSSAAVIEEAQALGSPGISGLHPLAASTALRQAFPDLTPDQCAAALTQAALRTLASDRYGVEETLFLTRDGLEQATRPPVARRRAAILAAAGCAQVVDLTAGLGFDARAFVAAGLDTTVVERSPETAAMLAENVPSARLVLGDATDAATLAHATAHLGRSDVVFIDPGRRDPAGRRTPDGARAQSERDPERWSPPWSFVTSLATHHRVCVKTTPGFAPEKVPDGWRGEWSSVAGIATEACLWSWAVFDAPRRAVRFASAPGSAAPDFAEFEGTGEEAPSLSLVNHIGAGAFVHEPDTSIIKAGLLDDLASAFALGRLDPESSWLTGDGPVSSPFIHTFEVVEVLPSDPKALRRALRERGVGTLTIRGRATGIDPATLRKRLDLDGPSEATIVLAVSGGRRVTLLVMPR